MNERSATPSEGRFQLVVGTAFGLLLLVSVQAHELWRDEAQAWWLSRSAPGFWSLLSGSARVYEGHPFVWFWLLRLVSFVSTSHLALQAVAFVVSVANVVLVLGLSSLLRYQRVLLAASYYLVFEFGVLARSYGLAVFWLLLGLTVLGGARRLRLLGVALCAGLAANTVLLALPAAALLVALACQRHVLGTWGSSDASAEDRTRKLAWCALAIFAACVALAFGTTPVPPDAVAQLAPWPKLDTELALELGCRLWNAFAPISPPDLRPDWWNVNVALPRDRAGQLTSSAALASLAGIAWLLAWLWVLRRERLLVFGLAVTVTAVALLVLRLPLRLTRYDGHVTLCLIIALLVGCARRPQLRKQRAFAGLFSTTFGAQALAGAIALHQDLGGQFSHSREAARFLRDSGIARQELVGYEYYRMAPLAAYLDQQLYSPELRRVISYGIWTRSIHRANYSTVSGQGIERALCAAQARARPGAPGYLVASGELRWSREGASPRLVKRFASNVAESYFVYAIDSPGVGAAGQPDWCRATGPGPPPGQ